MNTSSRLLGLMFEPSSVIPYVLINPKEVQKYDTFFPKKKL